MKRNKKEVQRNVSFIGFLVLLGLVVVAIGLTFVFRPAEPVAGKASESAQCIPPPADMVAWWSFDRVVNNDPALQGLVKTLVGDKDLDIGSTSRAAFTEGVAQEGMRFEPGSTVYVDGNTSLDLTAGLTIEGWFKLEERPLVAGEENAPAGSERQYSTGRLYKGTGYYQPYGFGFVSGIVPRGKVDRNKWELYYYLTKMEVGRQEQDSPRDTRRIHNQVTGVEVEAGSYHHVAMTYSSNGVLTLYVDGNRMYIADSTQNQDKVFQGNLLTSSELAVVAQRNGLNQNALLNEFDFRVRSETSPFSLDELSIYNRALSPAEIRQIAEKNEFGKCWNCDASNNGYVIGNAVCRNGEWNACGELDLCYSQCNACQGDQPGECVGSDVVFASTRDVSRSYSSNSAALVGCVEETNSCYSGAEMLYDEKRLIGVDELVCGNGHTLLSCPADAEYVRSDGGDWICHQGEWEQCNSLTRQYSLSVNGVYEAALQKNDCYISSFVSGPIAPLGGNKYTLCDVGTERLADSVSLCNEQQLVAEVVSSIESMRNENARPKIISDQDYNLTFLYARSVPKEVSAVLTKDITSSIVNFPTSSFTENLLEGQRILLKLGNDHYLLSYPDGDELFATEKLRLTHIPLGTEYSAELYAGTNTYLFRVLGDRQVTITVIPGGQVAIASLRLGEAPAAYVVPGNLMQQFELNFSATTPLQLTDPALGTLTLCREDNPADPQQALVCLDNQQSVILRQGNLTSLVSDGIQYAFLYERKNDQKVVSVFIVHSLSDHVTSLSYNDFINALVAGKRVSVEFEERLYLFRHPQAPTITLRDVRLDSYRANEVAAIEPTGSEDYLEFVVLDGKIILQRQYGVPPPPFEVTALTRRQITDKSLDLNEELFTTMSSRIPVKITSPVDLGIVGASADDVARYQQTFGITLAGRYQEVLYQQPFVVPDNQILLYYRNAHLNGSVPVKTMDIYRLYDLDGGIKSRPFTDQFIQNFTIGKEVALRYLGNYYLLGYRSVSSGASFFDIARVTLRSLQGSQSYAGVVDGETILFTLPEGKIRVAIVLDRQDGRIRLVQFSGDVQPMRRFVQELTKTNQITLPGVTLRLCSIRNYDAVPQAKVCDGNNNEYVVDPVSYFVVGDERYQLQVNGLTGDEKRVTVRKVMTFDETEQQQVITDWVAFMTEVSAGNGPLWNISGEMYSLQARGPQLGNLTLIALDDPLSLQRFNVQSVTPITAEGIIALNHNIFTVVQEEIRGEDRIQAELRLENERFIGLNTLILNATRDESTLENNEIMFKTALRGTTYVFRIGVVDGSRVRLSLATEEGISSIDRFFVENDRKVVRLDGRNVEIVVEKVTEEYITVTLRQVG